jgi:hypothetical protein
VRDRKTDGVVSVCVSPRACVGDVGTLCPCLSVCLYVSACLRSRSTPTCVFVFVCVCVCVCVSVSVSVSVQVYVNGQVLETLRYPAGSRLSTEPGGDTHTYTLGESDQARPCVCVRARVRVSGREDERRG